MPAPAQAPTFRQRITQEVQGFLGVNLRQERVSLADQDLAKAINADLHSVPGAIVLRLGRTAQFTGALGDLAVRRLARINGVRYQVAGQSLYRNQASILAAGLSGNLITTIKPFRPLNDGTIWAFIADDAGMRKDDGTNLVEWGVTGPTSAPSAAAASGSGSLSGAYQVRYTWVRKSGASVAHESNPSPATAAVTLAAKNLNVTGLQDSPDSQVTHKRIYRTVAGGVSFLFDTEVARGTTTATLSKADSALGVAVETTNNAPPVCSWIEEFQETMFFCRDADNPHYLWFSKRFRPESVPAANFIEIGQPDDPLQCAVKLVGLLAVFSRLTKYRVFGNASSGYVAQEALSRRGTPAPLTCLATPYGLLWVARDGIFVSSLLAPDEELSGSIAPIFFGESVNGIGALRWDYANLFSAAFWKGRYYVSLVTGGATEPNLVAVWSTDTKRWYFYDHPVRSLHVEEDLDDLVAGSTDGLAYVLEDGETDGGSNIALDAETKDFFGQSIHTRKLFLFFRVDADIPSGTLTADLYVDGALVRSASVSGSRTRLLLPVPEKTLGYTWRIRFRYTGTARERPKIYGAAAVWLPLEPS